MQIDFTADKDGCYITSQESKEWKCPESQERTIPKIDSDGTEYQGCNIIIKEENALGFDGIKTELF